jgi:cytochrome b561
MSIAIGTNEDHAAGARKRPAHSFGAALPFAKILHWTSAALLCAMFVSGVIMTQLSGGAVANFLYTAHKSCGVLVLLLLSLRLAYRLSMSARKRWLPQGSGKYAHRLLYAMGLAIPVLGWAGVSDYGARGLFFGLSLPEIIAKGTGYSHILFTAHSYMAFALVAVVVLHIMLALNDYITRGQE